MDHMEEPPPPPSDGDKKEFTKKAVMDSWKSIHTVLADPEGGQKLMLDSLGERNAYFAGIFLNLAIALSELLLFSLMIPEVRRMIHPLQLFILLLIPSVSVVVTLLLASNLFKSNTSYQTCVFVTGITMLPTFLPLFGLYILGPSNIEVLFCLLVATICFVILLLYSALRQVFTFSARLSFVLTPITLIVASYFSSIFIRMWAGEPYQDFIRNLVWEMTK